MALLPLLVERPSFSARWHGGTDDWPQCAGTMCFPVAPKSDAHEACYRPVMSQQIAPVCDSTQGLPVCERGAGGLRRV